MCNPQTGSRVFLKIPSFGFFQFFVYLALDPVHFGPALGTNTFYSGLTIVRFNTLGIAHLPFGAACHTICLHLHTSLFSYKR
jgi:hypothetical protein